ncbi:MAG: hypothetical protein OHK0046_45770 [Anaerolineae bacterium]
MLSSEISALLHTLEAEGPPALDRYWETVTNDGTPRFEPLPDDHPLHETHLAVTFLWRGAHTHVVLMSPFGKLTEPETVLMQRLAESDLWYRTYVARKGVRGSYYFGPDVPLEMPPVAQLSERLKQLRADPHNPDQFTVYDEESPVFHVPFVHSVFAAPDAPPQPYLTRADDTPQGSVERVHFTSAVLGNTRRVWVYTPPDYTPEAAPYDLLLTFDGHPYTTQIPTPTILDNLIAQGSIPPCVGVFIDAMDGDTRNRELPCNPDLITFFETEFMPWVRAHYHVTLNPARTVIAGSSYGGLAAAWCALKLPYLFGKVLSQAGSFWYRPGGEWRVTDTGEEFGWLIQAYVQAEKLPVTFYLDIGSMEDPLIGVGMNRHMRDVLRAKGYTVHYAEYPGAHDYACWRGTLSDGLMALNNTQETR